MAKHQSRLSLYYRDENYDSRLNIRRRVLRVPDIRRK
jgi:hypothetical protein